MMNSNFKRGGISMFMVIITATLVSLMVASFVRLTVRDNQNASKQDLSQSAYDSAQSGVEDAKRALANMQKICADASKSSECAKMQAEIKKDLNSQSCRLLAETFGIGDPSRSETIIQTNSGDSDLDQAYTCVKIAQDTTNFEGELSGDSSKIIPLKSLENVKYIRISWFTKVDNSGKDAIALPSTSNIDLTGLFKKYPDWNFPSVMRAQVVMPDGSYDYSTTSAEDSASSRTIFLMPSKDVVGDFSMGGTRTKIQNRTSYNFSKEALQAVRCSNTFASKTYACTAVVELDREVAGNSGAFLKLASQYNSTTNYSVELLKNDKTITSFAGVQPLVDSTGRANDQFRRVQARVEMNVGSLPIPNFAVATEGAFCKNMKIRDSGSPFGSPEGTSELNCK